MSDDVIKPRCYDCLSENVAAKVIDQAGFEHWFCAEDWAAVEEFSGKVRALLSEGIEAPAVSSAPRPQRTPPARP